MTYLLRRKFQRSFGCNVVTEKIDFVIVSQQMCYLCSIGETVVLAFCCYGATNAHLSVGLVERCSYFFASVQQNTNEWFILQLVPVPWNGLFARGVLCAHFHWPFGGNLFFRLSWWSSASLKSLVIRQRRKSADDDEFGGLSIFWFDRRFRFHCLVTGFSRI